MLSSPSAKKNGCSLCGELKDATHDLLQRGLLAVPDAVKQLDGWRGVPILPDVTTDETRLLTCPMCGSCFSACAEWYEFNDTGQPFTHQLTITRVTCPAVALRRAER